MRFRILPETFSDWFSLASVTLMGGLAVGALYLSKTYATNDAMALELDKRDSAMSQQHMTMTRAFTDQMTPLADLPPRVRSLEKFVEAHESYTQTEQKMLNEIAATLSALQAGQSYLREDQKRVMDVLDSIRKQQVRDSK